MPWIATTSGYLSSASFGTSTLKSTSPYTPPVTLRDRPHAATSTVANPRSTSLRLGMENLDEPFDERPARREVVERVVGARHDPETKAHPLERLAVRAERAHE